MKISRTHIIVLSILSLPLAYLTYLGGMNYSGYCFEENRYLTPDEKIRIAFNHFNNRTDTTIRIGKGVNSVFKSFKQIPYISFEEYEKENPDCCSVGKRVFSDLPRPDFFERISGSGSGKIVTLNFKSNYFDSEIYSLNSVDYAVYYVLTNCGKVKTFHGHYTDDVQK